MDEVANEISEATNNIIAEHNKETGSLNKLNIKRHNTAKNSTVVIGDSSLKGLRQRSIRKATIKKVTELWNSIKTLYIGYSHKRLRPRLHSFACLQFKF